jgi:hypothetical protein
MTKEIRDSSGRFKAGVSGNPLGRAVGGKSSKNKVSKNKLHSLWNKHGPESIELLAEMMHKAYAKEDLNNAIKIAMYIGSKYMEFTIYQDKVEIEEVKAKKPASEDDADEDGDEAPQVVVTFPRHVAEA